MDMHDISKVEKARKLRQEGLSFKEIGNILSVSDKTIRRWCLNIGSNNLVFNAATATREKIKKTDIEILKKIPSNKPISEIFAALLYWAEGTKYPNSVAVSFSNSDPAMVKFFIECLRASFNLDEKKFKIHLQIHTTHNQPEVFNYWSNLLNIPIDQFWKPTVTHPTRKMKRIDYKGTCTVRYHDYQVLLKLTGIFENLPKLWKVGRVA